MSTAYSSIPTGGNYDIPPSLPAGLLFKVKAIQNLSKQTIKMVPNNGQGDVWAGQKVIVTLPPNSLVDLSTFEFNYTGYTQHNGNAVAAGPTGYCQTRFFPRNSQSILEGVEIKINGSSRQNISQYNYLYNMLYDFTCGTDGNNKNRIGQNADPSCKYVYQLGQVKRRAGYPLGRTADPATANDQDQYSVRNWLGLLGPNASTTIIDTSMLGEVTIEISLAPSGVLMLGDTPGNAAINAVAAANGETGVAIAGGVALGAQLAAEGTSYKISDISFTISRIDLPQSVYDAMNSVLASGVAYQLWYPNYSIFTGQPTTGKSGTTRISISTSSLEMVIGTFQVPNRDQQSFPITYDYTTANNNGAWINNDDSKGEWGTNAKTFKQAVLQGLPITFNQSKYFIRNGTQIKNARWAVGNVFFNYETPLEMYNGVLKAFNSQNDVLGGCYEGLDCLPKFQDTYFAHILSLNAPGENDIYTVSGLNSSETPVQISWEVTGGDLATNNKDAIGGGGACTPVIIACYSSHLDIRAGRNITTLM